MEFHRGREQIPVLVATSPSNSFPTVYRQAPSENGFMTMVPLAFNARLKTRAPNINIASCPIRLHSPEGNRCRQ